MARTPASVDVETKDDGDHIVLICDLCDGTIYDGPPGEYVPFIAMIDAHDEHADEHGEGV